MRKLLTLVTMFVLLAGTIALADTQVKLRNGDMTPAADGYVKAGHDRNGNTDYHISVHHLAMPTQLTPAKSNYVVWIQRPGQSPENAGMLKVNDKLEGTFDSTTPYKQFDVFVTAEDNPKAQMPSSLEVLRGVINNEK
jgi:hypothetical protein